MIEVKHYLCEICGEDFDTDFEAEEHEKKCKEENE